MIGFFLLLYATWKHKEIVRVEFDKVGSFLGFLAFLTCWRIAAFSFGESLGIPPPAYPRMLEEHGMWRLFMVWWEDLFYVLPMFWIIKKFKPWIAGILIVLISMEFGSGHAYQGAMGVIITSLYPYFISYRYGKKYGLGTVMMCHVIYDFATVFTIIGWYMYRYSMY